MSALNKMLEDMVKKALPPELMQHLTQEKIESYFNGASAFALEIRTRLKNIEDSQERERASIVALVELVERLEKCQELKPSQKKSQNSGTVVNK